MIVKSLRGSDLSWDDFDAIKESSLVETIKIMELNLLRFKTILSV